MYLVKALDHVTTILHLSRDKFGLNSNLTVRQRQNRIKSANFGMAQENTFRFTHRSVGIPLGGSESVPMLTALLHSDLQNSFGSYIDSDVEKCHRLSERLLGDVPSSQDDSTDESGVIQYNGVYSGVRGNESLQEVVLVDDEKEK